MLAAIAVSYASVVLSDSEITFLGERKDVTFHPFLFRVLHNWRSMSSNFLVFQTS